MNGAPLLEMRGVAVRFGATTALAAVDFTLRAGEVHALLGENGAGKSTLMQVLAGAIVPAAGQLRLLGVPYSPSSPAAARRAGVAMVFQELTLLAHLSVEANLWLGRERTRGPWLERVAARRLAAATLARLGRADLDLDQRVGRLPPATRQLVEIGRALLAGARVLVLDEPTSSLGDEDARHLFEVVRQLRAEGLGIVFISHSLAEVRALADRCTVLRDGQVVATAALADVEDATLLRQMAGREIAEVFPPRTRVAGPVRLAVRGLGGAPLPAGVDLEVRAGEIVGIAGLCGAGRSELLRAVFGLAPRVAGSVVVDGEALPASPASCWQRGIGLLAEDRKVEGLAVDQAITTNLVLPALRRWRRGPLLRWAAAARAAAELGQRVGLRCRGPWQRVRELSGGNQQKVALARLLHAGCRVLLLDEPTRGIDVGARQEIYRLLDALAREGTAVLVVSSQLPELLGLCDRLAVMHKGRLGACQPVAAWSAESLVRTMLLGPVAAEVG